LQKALENFLSDFELIQNGYDFKICDDEGLIDDKMVFVIAPNGNLTVPFSKEKLIKKITEFEPKSLEDILNMMFDNFKKEVFEVIKKYEKG